MKAWAVIGANYGDEGKGLMTDYLVRKHNIKVVCRYNGGAQAGHTVQLPDGKRHVFHHFGSGTLAGAMTYLGPRFISNPYLFVQEQTQLTKLIPTIVPHVMVHPDSIVTTPYDMLLNQRVEAKRGGGRHGSCGVGIFETIIRDKNPDYRLTVRDLYQGGLSNLIAVLQNIRREYVPERAKELELSDEDIAYCTREGFIDSFVDRCWQFITWSAMADTEILSNADRVLFEGAQGLALDQYAVGFPHLTPSCTGSDNIIEMLTQHYLDEMELVYCTRSYLTRHGAGPLWDECSREDISHDIHDATNVPHDFQGTLRFAPMHDHNITMMLDRIHFDRRKWGRNAIINEGIAVTCLDQCENAHLSELARYKSVGPTHENVTYVRAYDEAAA